MSGDECSCDLLDVSTWSGPAFVRGFSRGCKVHPPSDWERRVLAAEAERQAAWDARVKAAEKAARERR